MNISEVIPFGKSAKDFYWLTAFEDAFVPQQRHVNERPLDEYELTQHYRFWKTDIEKAKNLGIQMLRYGIPWYKVNPAPGKFTWKWVDEVVDYAINTCKLELMIDLNHYNAPLWIENEYINSSFPERQAEYAHAFAERYQKMVHFYNPYNEPVVNAWFSGEKSEWPPYLHGDDGFVKVLLSLAKTVVLTVNAIREVDPESRFVHAEGVLRATTENKNLKEAASRIQERSSILYDLVSGRLKEDHQLYSYLTDNGASERDFSWFQDNRIDLDIIGVNYYPQTSHLVLYLIDSAIETRTVTGGKQYLEEWFLKYYKKYKRPMLLSETSFYGSSEEKALWLEESCSVIKRLRSQGIPIIGYTWWAMIDYIGWDYKWGQGGPEEYIGFVHPPERKNPRKAAGLYTLRPEFDGSLMRQKQPIVDIYASYIQNSKEKVGYLAL